MSKWAAVRAEKIASLNNTFLTLKTEPTPVHAVPPFFADSQNTFILAVTAYKTNKYEEALKHFTKLHNFYAREWNKPENKDFVLNIQGQYKGMEIPKYLYAINIRLADEFLIKNAVIGDVPGDLNYSLLSNQDLMKYYTYCCEIFESHKIVCDTYFKDLSLEETISSQENSIYDNINQQYTITLAYFTPILVQRFNDISILSKLSSKQIKEFKISFTLTINTLKEAEQYPIGIKKIITEVTKKIDSTLPIYSSMFEKVLAEKLPSIPKELLEIVKTYESYSDSRFHEFFYEYAKSLTDKLDSLPKETLTSILGVQTTEDNQAKSYLIDPLIGVVSEYAFEE